MRTLSRAGVAYALALAAITGPGANAQAVEFNPPGADVSGTAESPTLSYSDLTFTCEQGTVDGTTTDPASDTIPGAVVDFFEPCDVSGLNVTVDCSGTDMDGSTVNLIAQNDVAPGGTGTVELEDDFRCVFAFGAACTITVEGPQTTQDDNLTLDETNNTMTAAVTVQATREGSTLCGAATSGPFGFNAVYDMEPDDLTIDP